MRIYDITWLINLSLKKKFPSYEFNKYYIPISYIMWHFIMSHQHSYIWFILILYGIENLHIYICKKGRFFKRPVKRWLLLYIVYCIGTLHNTQQDKRQTEISAWNIYIILFELPVLRNIIISQLRHIILPFFIVFYIST